MPIEVDGPWKMPTLVEATNGAIASPFGYSLLIFNYTNVVAHREACGFKSPQYSNEYG